MIGIDSILDAHATLWYKSKYFRPVSRKDYTPKRAAYSDLMNGFITNVMNALLNGDTVILPASMGRLSIMGVPTRKNAVNWKLSKELGKKIFHLNEHFDGYFYKLILVKNQNFWYSDLMTVITEEGMKQAIYKKLLEGRTYFIKTIKVKLRTVEHKKISDEKK